MSVIFKESGWYRKTEDDDGYEYVGEDTQELAETLDNDGDLDYVVKEYVNDNYCLEDIIQEILDDCTRYTCREDIINEWIQNVENGTIYLWHGEVTYFEEGEESDMVDYVIDSEGERIEYVEDDEEDEEDDEEEEEDTD